MSMPEPMTGEQRATIWIVLGLCGVVVCAIVSFTVYNIHQMIHTPTGTLKVKVVEEK